MFRRTYYLFMSLMFIGLLAGCGAPKDVRDRVNSDSAQLIEKAEKNSTTTGGLQTGASFSHCKALAAVQLGKNFTTNNDFAPDRNLRAQLIKRFTWKSQKAPSVRKLLPNLVAYKTTLKTNNSFMKGVGYSCVYLRQAQKLKPMGVVSFNSSGKIGNIPEHMDKAFCQTAGVKVQTPALGGRICVEG